MYKFIPLWQHTGLTYKIYNTPVKRGQLKREAVGYLEEKKQPQDFS